VENLKCLNRAAHFRALQRKNFMETVQEMFSLNRAAHFRALQLQTIEQGRHR